MSNGYAGLTKRRDDSETEVLEGETTSAEPWTLSAAGRQGGFRIVEVDRRASDRVQMPIFAVVPRRKALFYDSVKRLFDVVGAITALSVFSPLIFVIVAIAWSSGGKPIFKHRRVGQNGVFFDCLKFRTMVPNANAVLQALLDSDRQIKEEWLRDHKLKDDPRVTRIGKFLRRSSLDELPQLWNVLRGEMSLVGPRPVVPDELYRYGNKVGIFLSAVPGVTGLWQVSGRNNIDYRRRVALDVCYIRSRSVLLDFYILLKTLPAVFAKNGAY
jgi:lipopolysaccharide/colanic/teichoic acid biosynthesis glycosyltransferase